VGRIVKGNKRYRYIGFRITFTGNTHSFTNSDLIQAIRKNTRDLFSKDVKDLGLWLIQFNGTSGIIKCHSQEKEHAMQLLQSLKKIGVASVHVTTSMTSGTIRGLTEKK
jgi:RNase P/RNase MRP subunit POP5